MLGVSHALDGGVGMTIPFVLLRSPRVGVIP